MPFEEEQQPGPNGATEAAVPAGPKTIAVIFPHPDDAEFLCGGAVARWVAEGHEVTYVLLTSGDKGSDNRELTTEQLIATREAEQRAACAVLGVKEVVFLHHEDAMLVNDITLRRELTRVIRRLKPDVVVTFDPTVRWASKNYFNHPDHRVTGDVTIDAIYPAARDRRTFPELLAEGLEPHKVSEVYLAGTNSADLYVDISDYFDMKLKALRAHVSQFGDWDVEDAVREWAREGGQQADPPVEYAEAFRHFELA
ncbi:MAG: PIG-L deacetylase family protein [Thermomicrobiales bacterium]